MQMGIIDFLVWFFWLWLFMVCIWAYIWIIMDIFRDHALNGWAKAGWVILIIVLPLVGALIYLIARGGSIADRESRRMMEAQRAQADYVRSVAGSTSPATEIERAQALRDAGTITEAEFDALKTKALA